MEGGEHQDDTPFSDVSGQSRDVHGLSHLIASNSTAQRSIAYVHVHHEQQDAVSDIMLSSLLREQKERELRLTTQNTSLEQRMQQLVHERNEWKQVQESVQKVC